MIMERVQLRRSQIVTWTGLLTLALVSLFFRLFTEKADDFRLMVASVGIAAAFGLWRWRRGI